VTSDDSGDARVTFVDTGIFSSGTTSSEDSSFSVPGTVSVSTGSPVFAFDDGAAN